MVYASPIRAKYTLDKILRIPKIIGINKNTVKNHLFIILINISMF